MEFALQIVSVFTKSLSNTTYFAIFYFVKSIIFVMKKGHQCLFLHRSELLYLCNATSNVKKYFLCCYIANIHDNQNLLCHEKEEIKVLF